VKFGSLLAIFFLFFVSSAFLLLPFGVKTSEELGESIVPGQAESAPHRFDLKRHMVLALVLGAVLTAIYYANWVYGWITADDLDFWN
jgi:predicted secreted protein